MGAFADAMSRFAQPLIDASDGSQEDLERALKLSQLCWNLAILPQESREGFLGKMQQALSMDDEEFQDLKSGVVLPMIQRHQDDVSGSSPPFQDGPTTRCSSAF